MIGGWRSVLRENLADTDPLPFKTPIFNLFSPRAGKTYVFLKIVVYRFLGFLGF